MTTDISEKGLETLIMVQMTGADGLAPVPEHVLSEMPLSTGNGWFAGNPKDYDRTQAIDVPQLFHFLQATQPEKFKKLGIADPKDVKDIARLKFLARLSNEIGKRGLIDVLRRGVSDKALSSICSTAHLHPATQSRQRCLPRIASSSPASYATAQTKHVGRWTCASSSMAYLSRRLNSRTA